MPLFGGVTGISLNRGFGFVQYEQESSAIEAIKLENGAVFRGKKMGGFCVERNG
jgi:RNA recognition motif-containing protein